MTFSALGIGWRLTVLDSSELIFLIMDGIGVRRGYYAGGIKDKMIFHKIRPLILDMSTPAQSYT